MKRLPVVDIIAGHEHFVDHTLPVWRAMPPEMRGAYITTRALDPGLASEPHSDRAGHGDLTLVCSYGDLISATYGDSKRPVVFMEHGAGFTFDDGNGYTFSSYSGAEDRENVVLFLNPNDYVSRANARAHPATPQVVIGSPKMDRWYPAPLTPYQRGEVDRPTVAIALHWDCIVAPGTRSAYEHYRGTFGQLKSDDWNLIGHAHPRMKYAMQMECVAEGIEFVDRLDTVFETADLLVADATSAMYEFASLGRPVMTLNAPWYLEEPDDGIRFWREPLGIACSSPDTLVSCVADALADGEYVRNLRRASVDNVYPFRGDAAQRAVRAIQQFTREFA